MKMAKASSTRKKTRRQRRPHIFITYRPREWARPFDRDRREWASPALADRRRSTMADAWLATVAVAVDSGRAFVGSGVVVVGARPPPAAAVVGAVVAP